MEKAVHITNLRGLKYLKTGRYQRAYWGVEFCQNLIPSRKDCEEAISVIGKNNMDFTLVTPFVTERGLKRLKEIFTWLKKKKILCEVVVNDWGVLGLLNSEFKGYFELVLGRLLVRQQRDPAMSKVLEKQPPMAMRDKNGNIKIIVHRVPSEEFQSGIKASYVNTSTAQNLLSGYGVKRVELNNLIQGINIEGLLLKKSIYTPYVNISTTRFCPMNSKRQKMYRINVCKKECQEYYDVLRGRALPKVIYKRGNTTFYKNRLTVKEASKNCIDRIIVQPEIPF